MPSLWSLPVELWGVIGEQASLFDLRQLRLTCKDFALVLAPRVLNSIKIDIDMSNYDDQLAMLRILATGKSYANNTTKTLHIMSLSPRWNDLDDHSNPDDSQISSIENQAKEHFTKALLSLRNVEHLSWDQRSFSKDTELWVHEAMTTILRTYCNIRTFHFRTSMYNEGNDPGTTLLPLPFEKISQLTHLGIYGSEDEYGAINFQHLACHISLYQDLTHITLAHEKQHRADLLGRLLLDFPDNASPLRLTTINLVSTVPTLTPPVLRHITNLTHLNMKGLHNTHPDPQHRLADLNDFYSALKDAGIQLHKLEVTDAPLELFSYLESYSGLQTLDLDVSNFFDVSVHEASEAAGRRFFAVITNHSSSLETLAVSYYRPGEWVFNPGNALAWSKLKMLQSARVVVLGTSYSHGWGLIEGDMPLLLETFLSLPRLRSLHIGCECDFEHPLYNPLESYTGIKDCICSFNIPIDRPEPFCIEFAGDTLRPVANAEGSCWEYDVDKLSPKFNMQHFNDDDDDDDEAEEGWDDEWDRDWDPEDDLEYRHGFCSDGFDEDDELYDYE